MLRFPIRLAALLAGVVLLLAASACGGARSNEGAMTGDFSESVNPEAAEFLAEARQNPDLRVATFAGGCFWCVEAPFDKVEGVVAAVSGFAGGTQTDPTYDEVASKQTDHHEAVQVVYDPDVVTYPQLLNVFWRSFDPTDAGGQFADRGTPYESAIFVHNDYQRRLAEASKEALGEEGPFEEPLVTPIEDYEAFYPAEAYHQDFASNNVARYESYAEGSGRYPFLRETWGTYDASTFADEAAPGTSLDEAAEPPTTLASATMREADAFDADEPPRVDVTRWADYEKPSDEVLRERLSEIAYEVTQQDGTERAFTSPLNDVEEPGLFVDILSGEPLFSSQHKFESGTGWPSFTRPLEPELVVERQDRSLGMVRTEVRSRYADNHIGHVFNDGPEPTGLRYCMNGAALRFIPLDRLEEEGYGVYLQHFTEVDV